MLSMIPMQHPDSHFLNAAVGWLELGNHIEANEDLERIAPTNRVHPDVLAVRWQIYAKAKKWEAALDIAQAFTQLAPDQSQAWNFLSITIYRLGRTQEAWDRLSAVAAEFSECWLTAYNMACFAAQLGNIETAELLIQKAIDLGDANYVRQQVMDDPDLERLREAFKLG